MGRPHGGRTVIAGNVGRGAIGSGRGAETHLEDQTESGGISREHAHKRGRKRERSSDISDTAKRAETRSGPRTLFPRMALRIDECGRHREWPISGRSRSPTRRAGRPSGRPTSSLTFPLGSSRDDAILTRGCGADNYAAVAPGGCIGEGGWITGTDGHVSAPIVRSRRDECPPEPCDLREDRPFQEGDADSS